MKYKFSVLMLIVLSAVTLRAQSVSFRFSTYVYGWQRIDSLSDVSTAKTTHLRGYQNLLFDFNKGQWSFNTLAQTEEDFTAKVGNGFNYRLYNAYIKGTNLFNLLDVKLGRQYIFAGVGRGTIDGLYVKVKAGKNKEYQVTLYGGALAPYTYDFKNYPSIKKNYSFGAQFTYYGVKDLSVGLSFTNKRSEPIEYQADRLDSLYNTVSRTISFDSQSERLAGLDFNYTYQKVHTVFGKAYVDVFRKKLYKGEFNVSALVYKNLRVSADYQYREPQIAFNSIFWVFEHKKFQIAEGGVDYTIAKYGINVYGKVGAVIYDGANSLKIEGGFTHPMFGLSFTRYMGYTGESDGVYGYYNRQLFKSKFTATASAGYSRYRLGDYKTTDGNVTVDKVNSFSGMLGINYRPIPQFSIDAQGQFMFNRIYKTDARFLVGLSYWFFKKI